MCKITKYIVVLITICSAMIYCQEQQLYQENRMNDSNEYKIKVISGDNVFQATLQNSQTVKDFISLLPLELKLDDYAGTEKIAYLPEKLSVKDAPSGYKPVTGDITYFAPWGNLAIFYKGFRYSDGLIYLGKFENGMEIIKASESLNVRIELIK